MHKIKSAYWELISTHCVGFAKWTSSSSHWRCSVRVFTFRSIMARANTMGWNPFWTKGTIFRSKNWHNSLAFSTTNTDLVFVCSLASVFPDKLFQLFLNFFPQIKLILSGSAKTVLVIMIIVTNKYFHKILLRTYFMRTQAHKD